MNLKSLVVSAIFASAFTSASALTVVSGNNPQPDQHNVVHNPCGLPAGSGAGNPVTGCFADDNAITVSVSSNEDLDFTAGGQARVEAMDGSLSTLTITLNPLSTVILNIQTSDDGFVTFSDGAGTSTEFAVDNSGSNFFTVTGITGTFLTFETTLLSGGAAADIVDDVRQIRISQVTAIPEPETYALMMAGLVALGFISRRRKTKK
jgi:hypothetical protein